MTKDRLRRYRDLIIEKRQLEQQLRGLNLTLGAIGPRAPVQLEASRQRLTAAIQPKIEQLTAELVEIEAALDALDLKERLVIRAYYIEGRKWDDVCRAVGYERSQVFNIHASAIRKLEKHDCRESAQN